MTTLALTINGRAYGPTEVRDELSMNDFLREYLGLTGTKFGCGAAQCLSCAIIVDNPDGTSTTSPTCVVAAANFNGKAIRTVEGHARGNELSALQKAFIEHFAFQCGYCTAGFLNESQVLLERLAKKPVARADLEKTIAEALDGHLCRCTGYIKYHEAVRDDLTMNDFLREYLNLTGTKFGCGAAQCLSCAVIVDDPDGTSHTSPTCIVAAADFDGQTIRTVEGHARDGALTPLQKAFVEHFAFQCGYCTAGFLNEGQVLLERLARAPVDRADLEATILEALDGHLCRCTGYVKYHEAVRDTVLADAGRYLR